MKLKKFFAGTFGLIFIVITIFIIWMINQLPSAKEIRATIATTNKKAKTIKPLSSPDHLRDNVSLTQSSTVKIKAKTTLSHDLSKNEENEAKKNFQESLINLMDEDSEDIRVCENLGKSDLLNQKHENPEMFQNDLVKRIFENERNDSFIEAARHPIKMVLKDPQLSEFLRELLLVDTANMKEEEKENFFDKIGFYSKAASISANLYNRKNEFETLADHTIHLTVLARLAHLKPNLVDSFKMSQLCEEIENGIKYKKSIDVHQERNKLIKLIKSSDLLPKDLDFDPSKFSQFKLNMDKKGLQFQISN